MKVLVAFEESQRVCKAFRDRGHEAFSCDILPCSGGFPEWHIQSDVLPLINGYCSFFTMNGEFYEINSKWDLIIAHPPCTYLSKAGARWLYSGGLLNNERYCLGLAAKDVFLSVFNADCDCICVENPVPLRVFDLPDCSQKFQPYYCGDPYRKTTCFWLKGLPLLKPTNIVDSFINYLPSNCSYYSKFGKGGSVGVAHTAKQRSKTFPGIAAAMAEQWG